MALVKRKTEEQRAENAQGKEQQKRENEARRAAAATEAAKAAFFATPAGRGREAYPCPMVP